MKISEIFVSLNGESRFAGLRTVFVRTFGCNIICNFCDSVYAIRGDDWKEMSVDEIIQEVNKFNCNRVTLTGGEPTLANGVFDLLRKLVDLGYNIDIETNGAVDLEPFVYEFDDAENLIYTMDWKCPGSGMHDRMIPENLALLGPDDVVKCVVSSIEDIEEMLRIKDLTRAQVYVSPVFGRIEPRTIAEYLINNEINDVVMQLQQHKYVFPIDMRGV